VTREGTTTNRVPRRRAAPAAALLFTVVAGLALLAAGPARAARGVFLTGLRSWSAPASTRIVFDFSAPVEPVVPDSGRARALVVSLPGQPLACAAGVPEVLGVRDGLVDSVVVAAGKHVSRLQLWMRDSTRFHVFALRADGDKPFRIVVDLARSSAAVATGPAPPAATPTATPTAPKRELVVAVDAGHGGEDVGARGAGGVLEKNVNLATALALAAELNRIPGIRAVLTRDQDVFIPLHERYRIAERAKADLFISLHANSTPRRDSGSGTEVFFLSLRGASDQATRDLADLENAADLVGGVPEQAEDDLVSILYDVKRASVLQQSQLLAETLLDHLTRDRRLGVRGVKQAGFVVLKSVEFPSVLVETAFINNATEARLLVSTEFQQQIARQLADGVRGYLEKSRIGYEGAGAGDDAAGSGESDDPNAGPGGGHSTP
jgi:N-acetylmuramoyl-L-alanine amidase